MAALLEQTRKRSVRPIQLSPEEFKDALMVLSDDDLGAVLSTIQRSPETTARDDAWHRRMPLREDLDQPASKPPYTATPDVAWCMANVSSGVRWPDRPRWIAERGSLGYSPRRRVVWRWWSHPTAPPSAVRDGTCEQYPQAAEISAQHAAQLWGSQAARAVERARIPDEFTPIRIPDEFTPEYSTWLAERHAALRLEFLARDALRKAR